MEFGAHSKGVIGGAVEVHRELGPGLLESACEQCLACGPNRNGRSFQQQHPQPVADKGIQRDCGYRIAMSIQDLLIIELRAFEGITGVHAAELHSYMKLAGINTDLLINFEATS
jgi:GxxExxY protein